MAKVINAIADRGLRAGIVFAEPVTVEASPQSLIDRIHALIAECRQGAFAAERLKEPVREMLRAGGYKPSGRGKPASEYLVRAAGENSFPIINNLVDINNYVSLKSGLPVSLLDTARTSLDMLLRFGSAGERYVFNPAGQVIELAGLICACRAEPAPGIPLGTPVKDSMEGKISEGTRSVVGIVYAPSAEVSERELAAILEEFAALLSEHGKAGSAERLIV